MLCLPVLRRELAHVVMQNSGLICEGEISRNHPHTAPQGELHNLTITTISAQAPARVDSDTGKIHGKGTCSLEHRGRMGR